MHLVESQWLKMFSLHLCSKVVLPSKIQFSKEILPKLVEKIKQLYVLPTLAYCYFVIVSFDLWMSKMAYDIFALVTNLLRADCQPKHIAVGLLEAFDASGHALTKYIIKLLGNFDLRKKIILYAQDEGSNLHTMTIALKSIVSCDILSLAKSFQGNCFDHEFFKTCQLLQLT